LAGATIIHCRDPRQARRPGNSGTNHRLLHPIAVAINNRDQSGDTPRREAAPFGVTTQWHALRERSGHRP
jgi:hypothetical protein